MILVFRLKDIDAAFSGKFKEQKDSSDNWLPVPDHKVPVSQYKKFRDESHFF